MNSNKQPQANSTRIAIIGGGIAGAASALYLSEIGLQVDLFEQGTSLVNGPPICHLHAGGNLYREISDEQCVRLLKESIESLRLFPDSIDYRPTVIAVPKQDVGQPEDLFSRLTLLQAEYAQLIAQDADNQVLGSPAQYYQCYDRQRIEALALLDEVAVPSTADQWMIPFAKHVDLETLKFPVVLVQEFGWNVFRLGATAALSLEKNPLATIHLNNKVVDIARQGTQWQVTREHNGQRASECYDFLINAAGFRSGEIDDLAGYQRQRLVEFKAAYVTQWAGTQGLWPEVIFHGERGTPQGMAQFTPYANNYVQLHGMTEQITLFDNGLVSSTEDSSQPQLDPAFLTKIDSGWVANEVQQRAQRAIEHMARYIPAFKAAHTRGKPLFGAQQIPGEDETLRAAGVSFEKENYARCEIVKASSVLSCADALTERLVELGAVDARYLGARSFPVTDSINDDQVTERAEHYTAQRDYPQALAYRNIKQS